MLHLVNELSVINNTIFTVPKIQAMRKLNNPTTTSFTGLFLTVVRFNLLQWLHSHKNKETFNSFFFVMKCFSYCYVAGRRKSFGIYKKQTVICIVVEDVIWFFGSNIACYSKVPVTPTGIILLLQDYRIFFYKFF